MKVGYYVMNTSTTEYSREAIFYLDKNGNVICETKRPGVRNFFEHDPVFLWRTGNGDPVFPKDGQRYLDALVAENNSSYSYYKFEE